MPSQRGTHVRYACPLALVVLLLPVAACGSDNDKPPKRTPAQKPSRAESPRPGDQKVTLSWKGEKRVYTVHAPPGFSRTKSLPLIVAMHPYPGDGGAAAAISGLNAKADDENFLVAYPDGLNKAFNAMICCGTEDDVGFIRTLTKRLTRTWNADPDRVYATGISNGGDMTYKLAVELPGTFAAIAPVSGGFLGTDAEKASYKPKTPVSVTTFLGGADQYFTSMDKGIKTWQKRLACTTGSPDTLGKTNIKRTEAKCRDGSAVVVYRLPDMGHAWPKGAGGGMSDPTAGISATDLMWDFFKSHTRKAG
ncbi:polyhydroxybutyrate depolymerase [Streptomyces sp. SID335]|nr:MULTISPECIES: PHB depolymerase family esterase [unclassified Streptomyces]MYY80323.1 polyhydroxybutyrate depolymerase [Streptomyces sp. SID335]NDZ88613.1 polyhydroxybutyrate depolymerase [Streptomyces sp. SID10115]NEA06179.1 polyhydroxybutyrate depolymerase [Streptomyces sp. SID10116]NEB50635.1 polyhydroxybutyrate depolymerase [Streptomyces sp. SID339]